VYVSRRRGLWFLREACPSHAPVAKFGSIANDTLNEIGSGPVPVIKQLRASVLKRDSKTPQNSIDFALLFVSFRHASLNGI